MNSFVISVDKGIEALAGYRLGKEMFTDQLKGKIDFSKPIHITIPIQVKAVSSSWVQGFFEEILDNVGYINFNKVVKIDGDKKIAKTIYQNLF